MVASLVVLMGEPKVVAKVNLKDPKLVVWMAALLDALMAALRV
jgi:hypothetical protein